MTETKSGKMLDHLSNEELTNTRGGVPYEKPLLIIFDAERAKVTCKEGMTCSVGNSTCGVGYYCKTGDFDPET
jgi:hypothetical protein